MICRKCKTALDENAKKCKYCGAKLGMSGSTAAVIALCGVVAATGSAALYISRTSDNSLAQKPAVEQEAQLPAEKPQEIAPQDTTEEFYTAIAPTPTPPSHTADADKSEAEVWDLVENMALTISEYYANNHSSRVILSKNGYLYNYPSKNYFTPKNFSNTETMKTEYADEQVLLLYIRPNDLGEYLEIETGQDLALFCAYEMGDGFAVANAAGRLGVISREDFQKLLALYSDEHGIAFRPENDSQDFADVVRGVQDFKGDDGNYDVRYIAMDDKYAFAVLSEKSTPERIEEYVLAITGDGSWEVGLSGFEDTFMYQKLLNNKFPDFNIGMLPPYNLYYSSKEIRSNTSTLVDAMRSQGMVSEEEGRTTFSSGTDKFCYVEFESGAKLLAVYTGTERGWLLYPVVNFVQAEIIMSGYDDDAPMFILKQ